MDAYIFTQDRTKLVLVRRDIEIKGNCVVHGNTLLGTYADQEEAIGVFKEIADFMKSNIHEYKDGEGNTVIAFASTCEVYEMPEQREKVGE